MVQFLQKRKFRDRLRYVDDNDIFAIEDVSFVELDDNNNYEIKDNCLIDKRFDKIIAGFIRTNEVMETSIPGLFAAGDTRVKENKQVITACSDGATAAMSAVKYINSHF